MAKQEEIFEEELDQEELDDRGDDLEDEEELEESGEDDEDEGAEEDEDGSEESEDDSVDDAEESAEVKDNIKIPKYRLDQEIDKRRAAIEAFEREAQRAAWLEEQLTKLIESKQSKVEPESSFDFEQAEEQYIDLILEGKTKEAAQLRKDIESNRVKQFQKIAEDAREEALKQSSSKLEDEKFQLLVENFESKHAFLNPKNKKSFNKEAVETINTFMAGFMAQGKSRIDALKSAVAKVAPMYESKSNKVANNRTVETRKKNIIASKKQPISVKSSRSSMRDVDTIDVTKLSDKDWKQLTPKEKAILRGDLIG